LYERNVHHHDLSAWHGPVASQVMLDMVIFKTDGKDRALSS
jgi:hypothetical protein